MDGLVPRGVERGLFPALHVEDIDIGVQIARVSCSEVSLCVRGTNEVQVPCQLEKQFVGRQRECAVAQTKLQDMRGAA